MTIEGSVRESLSVTHPELASEWDYEKNAPLKPDEITFGSGKSLWWICKKGHSWQASPNARTSLGTGCPYCANRKVMPGFNDLATLYPDLVKEWNYEENAPLTPNNVLGGAVKKVSWKCKKGHIWSARISDRAIKQSGCPYCANRKVLPGFNDLATLYPDLVKEWNYEENAPLTPNNVLGGAEKKVSWKCKKGHIWSAYIFSRTNGANCPYCANKKIEEGYNDLLTSNPEVAKEWDYEKNYPLTPGQVSFGTNTSVYWICPLGHSYKNSVSHRTSGENCPVCANRVVLPGYNDFETWCKQNDKTNLLEEWDYGNNVCLPNQITPFSNVKYNWICPLGHQYSCAIGARTNRGLGCPFCSNHQVLEGFNDFESWCKDNNRLFYLNEWNYEANIVEPTQVTPFSNKVIHWSCPIGHSYSKRLVQRTRRNAGCPVCSKECHTSFPEQAIYYFVKCSYPDAVNSDVSAVGIELDVYIPQKRIAIEYDGKFWHESNKSEKKKNMLCKSREIQLIRVREEGLPEYDDCICISVEPAPSYIELASALFRVMRIIDPTFDAEIDLAEAVPSIYAQFVKRIKESSLASRFPQVAKLWDYEKNYPITPANVSAYTHHLFFWVCPQGHSYQSSVASRTRGRGCPYCANMKVLTGFNDLATLRPDLVEEWNCERNIGISPQTVASQSNQSVWWKCDKGHEWEAKISNRFLGNGCPYCSGKRVLEGVNDFSTWVKNNKKTFLLNEWDYEMNDREPSEYMPKSDEKVYWICPEGHKYKATICNRTKNNSACPVCAKQAKNKRVICVETGEVYSSIKEAAKKTGGGHHISSCCNGKRKTAGGYHWKYCED